MLAPCSIDPRPARRSSRRAPVVATLLALAATAAFASEARASHPSVATEYGDWAVIDTIGRLQVLDGTWRIAGAPGGGIAGGIAPVQTGYDYRAFFVTTWDGRVRQYARQNGAWTWIDHGMPPCGPSTGAPTAAASGGSRFYTHTLQYHPNHVRQLYVHEWNQSTYSGTWYPGPLI